MKRAVLALWLALAPVAAQAQGSDLSNPQTATLGSWTPTLITDSTGNWTLSIAVGSYVKNGSHYTLWFRVSASASSSPLGNIRIGGLPATSTATTNDNGGCLFQQQQGLTNSASFTSFTGSIPPSSAFINVLEEGSGQTGQQAAVGRASSTPTIFGVCWFHT